MGLSIGAGATGSSNWRAAEEQHEANNARAGIPRPDF
jgi:hypothetical protein